MVAALGVALPILSAALSFAQAPPAVPALPDSERRTSYSLSGTTCSCSVGFALYASGSDVDAAIEVWVAGTRYLSTDPSHGWALTSATGTLATIPRPITDAVLTFTAVQTGTVQIVGAERPRRTAQFAENRGVAARDLNQALTDIIAVQRETWDRTSDTAGRAILGLPGEIIAQMPAALARQGGFLCFDSTGLIPLMCSPLTGTGNVAGPNTSVTGDLATFNGTTGKVLQDSGILASSLAAATALGANSAGIDANVLNAKIANYTIANTDCGKTIQAGTGSTGFFSVTLPSVSGFSAICSVLVVDGDAARAKSLSGFPAGAPSMLMPTQAIGVKIVNGAWALTINPGQWAPTSAITLFVDNVNGSDSNDCLAAGSGNACLTGNNARSILANFINNINNVTIQWASGSTYTVQFAAGSYNGPGSVTLDGNGSTISLSSATGGCTFCIGTSNGQGVNGIWTVRRFTISNAASGLYGVVCAHSNCTLADGITFGTITAGSAFACTQNSNCVCANNFTVSATAFLHVLDESDDSTMKCRNITITYTNTVNATGANVNAHGGGLVDVVGVTWTVSGSYAAGARYNADLLGLIDSGACNSIAGASGGTPTAGTLGTSGGFCN